MRPPNFVSCLSWRLRVWVVRIPGLFSPDEPTRYANIVENLTGPDYFLVTSDFTDYWRAQREVDTAYGDQDAWMRMAALNTARSGWFSSDRTIRGYMGDIWNARSLLED
mgnify:CR=1 FL=1